MAAAIVGVMGLVAGPALAVHDIGVFELDGNSTGGDDPMGPTGVVGVVDWDELNLSPDNTAPAAGLPAGCTFVASVFAPDPAGQTIFKGGNKDIHDIPALGHKSGSVPPKSELTNAYVAAFDCNDDLIIYFGSDRFAVEGNTFNAFWFYEDNVGPKPDGTFSGQHNGSLGDFKDVLILVNHEGGGSIPEIGIFAWVGTGGSEHSGTIEEIVAPGAAACNGVHSNPAEACAITNAGGITVAWPYLPKSGIAGAALPGAFYEGGVNFSALLGGDVCFGSFQAESRSSSSVTAQLKDFTGDVFEVCGVELTMICTLNGPNSDGFNADFSAFSYDLSGDTNATRGTLDEVKIWLDLTGDGVSVDDILMDTLLAPPLIGTTAEDWGPFNREDDENPVTYEAYAIGKIGTITVMSTQNATADCPAVAPGTGISARKACRTCLQIDSGSGLIAVEVRTVGQICNQSDVPLINVIASDSEAGPISLPRTTLEPKGDRSGDDCMRYSINYNPGIGDISVGDPGVARFSDTVFASGTLKLIGGTVSVNMGNGVSASCPLCPGGETVNGITCPVPPVR